MPKWLKRGLEANEAGFERVGDNAWKGLTDIVPEGQKKKGKGKGKGNAALVEKSVEDEEAMNGDAAAAQTVGEVQNGENARGIPEGKKEKRWELRIGFEGKGKAGVLDIEVTFWTYVVCHVCSPQECPIATPILNRQLVHERKKVQE
jgi:hypothetical protein